jgi:hypothetical protein
MRPMGRFDALVAGAKDELTTDPKRVKAVREYQVDQMRVLERQKLSRDPSEPSSDPTDVGPVMYWTITTFVPTSGGFESHELTFVGLTESQFEKDHDFLSKILDTLKYDPKAPMNMSQ